MQNTICSLFFLLLFSPILEAQEIDEILEREEREDVVVDENVDNLNIKKISGLGNLTPFEDIAVIQKRFLPRTSRFEVFPNVGLILNDAFFTNYIYGAKFAYHFSEEWGLEASYLGLSKSRKDVVKDLESETVETTSIVVPQSYMGVDLKWSPMYGKMAWMNKDIVPYDIYFTGGMGILESNQKDSPLAFHFGFGQSFAVSKFMAIRWDTSLYWYQSDVEVDGNLESGDYMNLHLTLGASFFFPEAKYR